MNEKNERDQLLGATAISYGLGYLENGDSNAASTTALMGLLISAENYNKQQQERSAKEKTAVSFGIGLGAFLGVMTGCSVGLSTLGLFGSAAVGAAVCGCGAYGCSKCSNPKTSDEKAMEFISGLSMKK